MNIAIISINHPSLASAKKLLATLKSHSVDIFNKSQEGDGFVKFDRLDDILKRVWSGYDAIVFIMATGAVVRKIAPHLKDKATDPAVLIMTLDLKRVIPLVSGHLGGANELSQEITLSIKGCVNFVTTATDQMGVIAFDSFAKKMNFSITNLSSLATLTNTMLNKKHIQLITYPSILKELQKLKEYKQSNIKIIQPDSLDDYDEEMQTLYITPQKLQNNSLQLHPKEVSIGLGMNRDTTSKEIAQAVRRFCYEHSLEFTSITSLASFEAKSDEAGLLEYAKEVGIKLRFFNKDEINALEQNFSPSQATKFFNIKGVAEPASLLASNYKTLFLSKRIYGGVTVAGSF